MYIKEMIYRDKLTQILFAEEGYALQHKETKMCYSSVSLEDGRKQEDYEEIEVQKRQRERNKLEAEA